MVYTREEMAALVKVIEKHPQVLVVSDEIYEHITFTGAHISLATFTSIADRVVTVNGVSKGICNDRMEDRLHGSSVYGWRRHATSCRASSHPEYVPLHRGLLLQR